MTDNMSLGSNAGRSPAHSTAHTPLGYTQILEGGRHPAWGERRLPCTLPAPCLKEKKELLSKTTHLLAAQPLNCLLWASLCHVKLLHR